MINIFYAAIESIEVYYCFKLLILLLIFDINRLSSFLNKRSWQSNHSGILLNVTTGITSAENIDEPLKRQQDLEQGFTNQAA